MSEKTKTINVDEKTRILKLNKYQFQRITLSHFSHYITADTSSTYRRVVLNLDFS